MSNKRNKRARQKVLKTTRKPPSKSPANAVKATSRSDKALADRLSQAIRHHQNQQFDKAEELYESVLREQPSNVDAMHFLGVLLSHQGNTADGEQYIRQALKASPDYFDAQNNLGNILQVLGRYDEAEACYEQSQKLKPHAPEPLINLAAMRLMQKDQTRAKHYLDEVITIAPTNPQTHKMLARIEQTNKNYETAIEHLSLAIEHGSGSLQLNSLIDKSRLLTILDKKDEAIELYQTWLSLHPEDETAKHMLAALDGSPAPERPGEKYVKDLFDRFAMSFDTVLEALDYQAPELIKEYMKTHYSDLDEKLMVVDAGCGTGLCGSYLKPVADTLIGVDLSPAMLNRARILNHYDELIEDDLIRFFEAKTSQYDLVVSADTIIYLGTLDRICKAVSQSLKSGSEFIFTLEFDELENDQGYRLMDHGRYSHTKDYATGCLQDAGFTITHMEQHQLRMERGEPVLGMLIAASTQ